MNLLIILQFLVFLAPRVLGGGPAQCGKLQLFKFCQLFCYKKIYFFLEISWKPYNRSVKILPDAVPYGINYDGGKAIVGRRTFANQKILGKITLGKGLYDFSGSAIAGDNGVLPKRLFLQNLQYLSVTGNCNCRYEICNRCIPKPNGILVNGAYVARFNSLFGIGMEVDGTSEFVYLDLVVKKIENVEFEVLVCDKAPEEN